MKKISNSNSISGELVPMERRLLLYVEDDPKNRTIANLHLRKNFDLLLATDAKEACELIKKHADDIDAILMDIELQDSELDGIELTKLLRGLLDKSSLPPWAQDVPIVEMPILFVTAYGDRYSENELLMAGGNRVIRKPVDFVQLTMALTRIRLQQSAK